LLPVLRPDWPAPPNVQALCTTRHGGVSLPPYDSLNLGLHVQDDAQAVHRNRALLHEACGARPVFLSQVHGTQVLRVLADTPDGEQADACWSDQPNVACTIMVADCLPVLFTDARGRCVAAAHAGWRGLAGGVLESALQQVCQAAACQPSEVLTWLGPCIGPTAFEVGNDVHQAFGPVVARVPWFQSTGQTGKWWADLAGLARWRLTQAGVEAIHGNDSTSAWCTVTEASRFFSYRRDGRSGRFAACIWRRA
jgi:YfiH family protein